MKEVLLAFVFALLVGSWLNGNQQVNTLSGPQVEIQSGNSSTSNSSASTSSAAPFEPIQPESESAVR